MNIQFLNICHYHTIGWALFRFLHPKFYVSENSLDFHTVKMQKRFKLNLQTQIFNATKEKSCSKIFNIPQNFSSAWAFPWKKPIKFFQCLTLKNAIDCYCNYSTNVLSWGRCPIPQCGKSWKFTLPLFWQKFHESNVYTKDITKELIWWNIFSVRVNFSFFHTVHTHLVNELDLTI